MMFKDKGELRQWAKDMAKDLRRPCVILLDGDLGAGKTHLVRWLAEALGGSEVSSPTFAIHHEYQTPEGPIGHVDLYRIQSDQDLEATGFWDLLNDDQALLCVEWASRLPEEVWPKSWEKLFIHLIKGEGEERQLKWRRESPS